MSIQYQTSGHWIDTDDRADYFVDKAAAIAHITREEAYAKLAAGEQLSYDRPYEHLRDTNAAKPAKPKSTATVYTLKCRKCGATGQRGQYPFSTLPGSGLCDDCL